MSYSDLEMVLGPQPTAGVTPLVFRSEVLHSTGCTASTRPSCSKPLTSRDGHSIFLEGIQLGLKSFPGHGESPQPQAGYSPLAICSRKKSSIQH